MVHHSPRLSAQLLLGASRSVSNAVVENTSLWCVHGLCVTKGQLYSCQCAEGFQGRDCDHRQPPPACRGQRCGHGECRVSETGEPVCHRQAGYTGPTCDTELTCHGEVVREQLRRHHLMKTCTSTSKIPLMDCPRSCQASAPPGVCCGPTKSRRRKAVFCCTDGTSYSEEMETATECGCAKCHYKNIATAYARGPLGPMLNKTTAL